MRCDPTLDSFAAFADDVVQPASVKGNSLLDTISGIVKNITPAAQAAVTNAMSGQKVNSKQLAQSLLNKPAVQPSTNYTPWLIGGGLAAIVLVVFLARRK